MDQIKTGKLIADLRKQMGMNQTELAQMLNISNRTVSKWENGDGFPDISLIPSIAEIFGIATDELFAGELNEREEIENTPKFSFSSKLSYKSYAILMQNIFREKAPVWFHILSIIMLFVLMCLVYEFAEKYAHYVFFLIIFDIILFFTPYFSAFFLYLNEKQMNIDKIDTVIEVSDKLYFNEAKGHKEYDFSDLTGFYDYKDHYIFKMSKNVFCAVEKSDLTTGNNIEFESYMRSKVVNKKKSILRRMLQALFIVASIIAIILAASVIGLTYDTNNVKYQSMSVEEILEMDDYESAFAIYSRIDDKVEYDSYHQPIYTSLNQYEQNYYYAYLFFYEWENGGICQYFANCSREANYLCSALYAIGYPELSNDINNIIRFNDIDLAEITESGISYEELLEQHDFEEIDASIEESMYDIPHKLHDYVKQHQDYFDN